MILLYPSMPCKFKITDRFQRLRKPHFALAKVCNFLVNLVTRVLSYPSLGTRLSSVHLRVATSRWKNLDVKWAIYIIIKKIIFIMRTVSALGLVLKVRVLWFLEVVKGLLTAWVSGVSGGKRGKKKRKSPVSYPLRKAWYLDQPIEGPVYKCHISQLLF